MLNFIVHFLSFFGICWIILAILVLNFGGSIKVIVNNPITKEKDVITNIEISK